jgi:hypothetical protein
MDSYLTRPVRVARALGIIGSWGVWIAGLFIALATDVPQALVLLIMVVGFTPYIISLKIVEPWLMKRVQAQRSDGGEGDSTDGQLHTGVDANRKAPNA